MNLSLKSLISSRRPGLNNPDPATSLGPFSFFSSFSSLLPNAGWSGFGAVMFSLSQWLLVVLISKIAGPEVLGNYILALSITAPVILLANLQLRAVYATDIHNQFSFVTYVVLRLATTGVALFVIAGIALVSRVPLGVLQILAIVALTKGIEAMSDIGYGLLQRQEGLKTISISQTYRAILAIACVVLTSVLVLQVTTGLAAILVCSTAVLLLYDLRACQRILSKSTHLDRNVHVGSLGRAIAKLLKTSFPLGATMMFVTLTTNIPRYIIAHFCGNKALGIFGALGYIGLAGGLIVGALGEAAYPRLSRYYHTGDLRSYKRTVVLMLGMTLLLGIISLIIVASIGPKILGLVYRPEYVAYNNVLVLLVLAGAITNVGCVLGYAATAARQFTRQLPICAALSGISFMAGLFFIRQYGIAGAAIAQITVAIVHVGGFAAIFIKSIGSPRLSPVRLDTALGGSAESLDGSRMLREEVQ
jgi:O-antigen/teichoic acid export membrane protein